MKQNISHRTNRNKKSSSRARRGPKSRPKRPQRPKDDGYDLGDVHRYMQDGSACRIDDEDPCCDPPKKRMENGEVEGKEAQPEERKEPVQDDDRERLEDSKVKDKGEKDSQPNRDTVENVPPTPAAHRNLLSRQAKPFDPGSHETKDVDLAASANADIREGGFSHSVYDLDEAGEKEIRELIQLLAKLGERRGTFVPRFVRRIVKNGDEAILLSQILYWFDIGKGKRPRAQAQWKGERFLAKTQKELGKEIGIMPRRVRDCLKSLQEQGFLRIEHHRFAGIRKSFIRPELSAVKKAVKALFRPRR